MLISEGMNGLSITDIAAGVFLGMALSGSVGGAILYAYKHDRFGFWGWVAIVAPSIFVLASLYTEGYVPQ